MEFLKRNIGRHVNERKNFCERSQFVLRDTSNSEGLGFSEHTKKKYSFLIEQAVFRSLKYKTLVKPLSEFNLTEKMNFFFRRVRLELISENQKFSSKTLELIKSNTDRQNSVLRRKLENTEKTLTQAALRDKDIILKHIKKLSNAVKDIPPPVEVKPGISSSDVENIIDEKIDALESKWDKKFKKQRNFEDWLKEQEDNIKYRRLRTGKPDSAVLLQYRGFV